MTNGPASRGRRVPLEGGDRRPFQPGAPERPCACYSEGHRFRQAVDGLEQLSGCRASTTDAPCADRMRGRKNGPGRYRGRALQKAAVLTTTSVAAPAGAARRVDHPGPGSPGSGAAGPADPGPADPGPADSGPAGPADSGFAGRGSADSCLAPSNPAGGVAGGAGLRPLSYVAGEACNGRAQPGSAR